MLFLTPMDRFCIGDSVWVECKIKFLSKGQELMVAHGEEMAFMTRKDCCYKASEIPQAPPKPAKFDLSKMRELNWFETIENGDWVRTSTCGRVKPVEYCFGMTVNHVFDYVKNNINADEVVTFYRLLK